MAQLGALGNLSETKVSNGFEPIPAGKYRAQVIETEIKQTKDGSGQLLKATFEILDGEHAGKKVFANYNLVNKSQQAQDIGKGQLKALATYAGHPNPNMIRATEELHGRPVIIVVSVRPAKDGYDAANDIKSYETVGGTAAKPAAPAAGFAAPKPQAPPAPAAVAPPVPAVAAPSSVAPQAAAADDGVPAWTDTPPAPAPVQVPASDALKAAAGF